MDLSAATRFASSAGATEVAFEELKGLAAAGEGAKKWHANADKMGFLWHFLWDFCDFLCFFLKMRLSWN